MNQSIRKTIFFVMLTILLSPLSLSTTTTNPSFDCSNAKSEAEKMVCSDPPMAMIYFKDHPHVPLALVPSASGTKYAVGNNNGISMEF